MDIQNKTVLILGAWGLVGNAVTRKIIKESPKKIIVTSLFKKEAESYVERLIKDFPGLPSDYFVPWWGNIFVRNEFKDMNRFDILNDSQKRKILLKDVMEEMTSDVLKASSLYHLIKSYEPDIVIDSINSATGIAYQDIYSTYNKLKHTINSDSSREDLAAETEKLLCTQYIPQLIRHIQILYNSMNLANTEIYVKIGTSGTGGMGLNIPYTHSEEKPSRVLLSKSSVAGAHTMLLFLMGRTPEGAITKEIKPTGAIAWKRITYDEITKRGKSIDLVESSLDNIIKLEDKLNLKLDEPYKTTGEKLKSVFIDTGENGTFSRGEFETISAQGQMEYVTPEEIAENVIYEIKGGNTGHDIINALDNASLSPTYRAGYLQHTAVEKLKELEELHEVNSVAFELLGPPRLSKLLHELNLLKLAAGSMENILSTDASMLSENIYNLLLKDEKLRSEIISIGIPILMSDGKSLLRGNEMKIPPFRGDNQLTVTDENIDLWAHDGWVDLRNKNMDFWKMRIKAIMDEANSIAPDDTSSLHVRTKRYWNNFKQIDIGKVVSWIFIHEEKGKRMK